MRKKTLTTFNPAMWGERSPISLDEPFLPSLGYLEDGPGNGGEDDSRGDDDYPAELSGELRWPDEDPDEDPDDDLEDEREGEDPWDGIGEDEDWLEARSSWQAARGGKSGEPGESEEGLGEDIGDDPDEDLDEDLDEDPGDDPDEDLDEDLGDDPDEDLDEDLGDESDEDLDEDSGDDSEEGDR